MSIEETLREIGTDDGEGRYGLFHREHLVCPNDKDHHAFHAVLTVHVTARCVSYPLQSEAGWAIPNVSVDDETAHMPTPIDAWVCDQCGAIAGEGRLARGAKAHTWEFLGRPGGGDYHRYFRDVDSGAVAIADNSGQTPDDTDDGPLWIDRNRPVRITTGEYSGATVPVICSTQAPGVSPDDELPGSNHVGVSRADVAWLLKRKLIDASSVVLPDDIADVMAALGAA